MTLITYCGEAEASRRRKSAIGGVGSVDVLKHDLLFYLLRPKMIYFLLDSFKKLWYNKYVKKSALIAQLVEHVIGNDEVGSSSLLESSKRGNTLIYLKNTRRNNKNAKL